MKVLPGNASHIGRRQQQQDAFALSDFADAAFVEHGGYLAVVADGVGGLLHGAEAADIAVTRFVADYLSKASEQTVSDALDEALGAANRAVCDAAFYFGCAGQLGTTLIAAVIHQGQLYWRGVGDSHLYLCRDGRLSQLNADHNFARQLQILVNEGIISQQEADNHPERQALESFLGLDPLPERARNRQPLPLKDGDALLLCTDGIYGVLSADDMIACLNTPPMAAAQALCDAVLARQQPNQDNLTAVVLACEANSHEPIPSLDRISMYGFTGLFLVVVGLILAEFLA